MREREENRIGERSRGREDRQEKIGRGMKRGRRRVSYIFLALSK